MVGWLSGWLVEWLSNVWLSGCVAVWLVVVWLVGQRVLGGRRVAQVTDSGQRLLPKPVIGRRSAPLLLF